MPFGLPTPSAFGQKLGAQFQAQGGSYVLQTASSATGLSPADLLRIGNMIAAGQYGDAAIEAETLLVTTYGGPVGTALGALIVGIEALYANDHPAPCTVPGCENAWSLPACAAGNPFTWAALGSDFEYVPPQGNQPVVTFPWSGLTDWGASGFGSADPSHAGGTGSFEEAFERAMMARWDASASSPSVCALLGATKGNIGYGSGNMQGAVFATLMAQAGAALPGFVAAWNLTHDPGVIETASAGSCPGGTYRPGSSGSNGTCITPAPPRRITFQVGDPGTLSVSTDPLQMAYQGLAQLAGLPAGATVAFDVNGGTLSSVVRSTPNHPAKAAAITVGVVVGAAAVAAAGVGVWAWLTHQAFEEAVTRAAKGARESAHTYLEVGVPSWLRAPHVAERKRVRR